MKSNPSGVGRILVVEDDPLVRMVAVDYLEEAKFLVEEADNAAQALLKIQGARENFDAVVLDIGLPDRNGDDLAVELRALRSDMPILIASGYDSQELRERFSGDSRICFVSKPYAANQLIDTLAHLGVRAGG